MTWISSALLGAAVTLGQAPTAPPPTASTPMPAGQVVATESAPVSFIDTASGGGFLKGDTCFPRFISPVTNPVFSKDPRSFTYARALFIHDTMDSDHPPGSTH